MDNVGGAKQMKGIDIHALQKKPGEASTGGRAVMDMMGKPSTIPAKGESPKAAEMDGPYGGKKPQS